MRKISSLVFIGTVLFLVGCSGPANQERPEAEKTSKPNVIFIMADDLGYGDLGIYGQQDIMTPNIDQLAREGMLFTQYYVGSPVCGPSRCSLLSGMHAGRMPVRGNANQPVRERFGHERPEIWNDIPLADSVTTMAEMFKASGYKTGVVGKWGLGERGSEGDPQNQGFDYFYGYYNHLHAHNHFPEYLWDNGEKVMLGNEAVYATEGYALERGSSSILKKVYSQDLLIEKSKEFIIANEDTSFFLYLPVLIPHTNNEHSLTGDAHGQEVPTLGPYEDEEWPVNEKSFASMITYLDNGIGELMELLKERGLEENTIVVFTSDNGPHGEGNHDPDFFDSNSSWTGMKRDIFEGGIRVPFMVKWPETIKPGSVASQSIAAWDVMATLGEIIDGDVPDISDGVSFYPVLMDNQEEQSDRYFYWELDGNRKNIAVSRGDWKLVRLAPSGTNDWETKLYNLAIDPSESKDLSAIHPDIMRELEEVIDTLRTKSDLFPIY